MQDLSGKDPLDYKEIITLFPTEEQPFQLTIKKKARLNRGFNDEVISRIVQFWEKRRIRFGEISGDTLNGKRGSLWWNAMTFDMSKLKADLTIFLLREKRIIECLMTVDTRFQKISPMNRAYFEMEMDAFSAYLLRGEDYEEEWRVFNATHRKDNLRWVARYIIAALIIAAIYGSFEWLMWMLRQ
ncbi:MAG TPA: hypothetical protein VFV58_01420 [Blastocatellia bacterium]|jgi:hypothetical protein|nr:hypothetical protein [Blastocatellia bacterium]